MPVCLKPFDPEETTGIFRLLEDIYSASGTMSENFSEKFPDIKSCGAYFSELAGRPGAVVLFASAEGGMAGFIAVKPRIQAKLKHTSELTMGVHSKYRGQGIGTLLLSEALKMLGTGKITEIVYLTSRADNEAAARLYENFGFEKIAFLDKDTKIGNSYFDGVLMRKFI